MYADVTYTGADADIFRKLKVFSQAFQIAVNFSLSLGTVVTAVALHVEI